MMKPVDIIVLAVVAVIMIAIVVYLCKAKKKGIQCIGCPDSAQCAGNCSGCSGHCSGCNHEEKA